MNPFKYDMNIAATKEEEADAKMAALIILAAKLTAKELTKLAYIVKHDPIKTAIAKRALGV